MTNHVETVNKERNIISGILYRFFYSHQVSAVRYAEETYRSNDHWAMANTQAVIKTFKFVKFNGSIFSKRILQIYIEALRELYSPDHRIMKASEMFLIAKNEKEMSQIKSKFWNEIWSKK